MAGMNVVSGGDKKAEIADGTSEKLDISIITNTIHVAPNEDMPFFQLKKDEVITVTWDGEYMRCGPLTWTKESLLTEINNGAWQILFKSNN